MENDRTPAQSATPDLLDVVKRFADYHGPNSCPADLFNDTQAAIAKAEGK